ncbi:hypothetical protein [Streptomyces sp. 135]|uniref:hypothetical protein n=1 Tax=Streptomyces sp. 135 TaxID=2838850 RepID=UPI001CC13D2C|nr:hypothetical protein [Streptomyces sp. 135]
MSEYDSQRPDHVCDEGCAPHVPLLFRELEDLEESVHIDALYDELNRVRERAAILTVMLPKVADDIRMSTRSAALLLDLDQEELEAELGGEGLHPVTKILDYAIRAGGEDGYVGQAMAALFREELGAPLTD